MNAIDTVARAHVLKSAESTPRLLVDRKTEQRWALAETYYPRHRLQGILVDAAL